MEESMTETEYLLREARSIAMRVLGDHSETVVLDVFRQLCIEIATTQDEFEEGPAKTIQ